MRLKRRSVYGHDGIINSVVIRWQQLPLLHSLVESIALRYVGATSHVFERRFVGSDHPCPGAALDRHVADGHPTFHGHLADGLACVLYDVARAAGDAYLSDDGQDQVFGRDAEGQRPVHVHLHGLVLVLSQSLGGQHVLDFRRADTERKSPKRAVRGRVAISTHNDLPRLRIALFRPHHVDNAVQGAVHIRELDVELLGIVRKMLQLLDSDGILDGLGAVRCGDIMIGSRHCQVGATHTALRQTQTIERLVGGDFMDQVEVYVDNGGLAWLFRHHVGVPNLIEHRLPGHKANLTLRCNLVIMVGATPGSRLIDADDVKRPASHLVLHCHQGPAGGSSRWRMPWRWQPGYPCQQPGLCRYDPHVVGAPSHRPRHPGPG